MGCFCWELIQYIGGLMTSRAVSFWRIHTLCLWLWARQHRSAYFPSFSSDLAKLEFDECVLSSSLATAIVLYLSPFVSLSWVWYIMCWSGLLTVSVCACVLVLSILSIDCRSEEFLHVEMWTTWSQQEISSNMSRSFFLMTGRFPPYVKRTLRPHFQKWIHLIFLLPLTAFCCHWAVALTPIMVPQ